MKIHAGDILEKLLAEAQTRHNNKIRIRPKAERAWMWRLLTWLLNIPLWGKAPDLLSQYCSLIGSTLWVPGDGTQFAKTDPVYRLAVLAHEIDHIDRFYLGEPFAQCGGQHLRRRWYAPVRAMVCSFWYLVWKPYRREAERTAYTRTAEYHLVAHGEAIEPMLREWLVSIFAGAHYGYMCGSADARDLVREVLQTAMMRWQLAGRPTIA